MQNESSVKHSGLCQKTLRIIGHHQLTQSVLTLQFFFPFLFQAFNCLLYFGSLQPFFDLGVIPERYNLNLIVDPSGAFESRRKVLVYNGIFQSVFFAQCLFGKDDRLLMFLFSIQTASLPF